MKLFTVNKCNCDANKPLIGGNKPEYYNNPKKAASRFIELFNKSWESEELKDMYFSVHTCTTTHTMHIIGVRDD